VRRLSVRGERKKRGEEKEERSVAYFHEIRLSQGGLKGRPLP